MTKYGTICNADDDEGPVIMVVTEQRSTKKMSTGKLRKLIVSKMRRHTGHSSDDSEEEERVGLCPATLEDTPVSPSPSQVKHRKMRGIWKGMVEAIVQQFYFMTVSIENSGGLYRATTVTRPDGTIGTELRYCPAPTLVTCKS